jgi:ribosome-associated protein
VKAVADRIEEGLAEMGVKPWHREGYAGRRWILLDFVDTVVHIFHRETREYYLLERLWGDAPVTSIDE